MSLKNDMQASLDPAVAARLSKLVPRLASDQDGEVVATARAIQRVLSASGASLHELASFLEQGPGERIVYRERVVYRDAPPKPAPKPQRARKPKPASEPERRSEARPASESDPHKDWSIGYQEVVSTAHTLIETGGMTEREEAFVIGMQQQATRFREGFAMTVKQARWWRAIVELMGVSSTGKATA